MRLSDIGPYTYWQIGVLKIAVLVIGIALGAYFAEFFLQYLGLLLAAGILLSLYLGYVWFMKS